MSHRIHRRQFLFTSVCGGMIVRNVQSKENNLIRSIQREIIWNGRKDGVTWFHPRACILPRDPNPLVLMTCQSITGSDVFGQVHVSFTSDLGRTWTPPQPIHAFARHSIDGSLEEGACDVVPQYHQQTGVVLAIGHNVYYKEGKLTRPDRQRFPVYSIYDPQKQEWSNRKKIQWSDPRATAMYTCGCGQRLILENGDLLIPFSFAPNDRTDRAVGTVLASFDGDVVAIKQSSEEMRLPIKRGLLEPSIVRYQDRYFITIRAEDDHGYVSVSNDGMHWRPPQPWSWDTGEPLATSTTQQHWICHSRGLFLVYTRKDELNINVFRWRSPLYIAQVNPETLQLIRESEQIVLPLAGDGVNNARHVSRMGNFHTTNVTPFETWATVGETLPEDGWKGDTLLARIIWNRANAVL